jgi:hypothetical protein
MSKSFKYVKDFVFPGEAGYSGSAGKTAVKGYYRGGNVDRTKKVIRNEREELNRVEAKRKDAGQEVKRVKAEMRYDKAELKGDKKPGAMMLKKGGQAKGEAKIGKVMTEYKEGELHSGSKKGPEVTNRKQAVAIALSEARKAGAKIPVKKAGGGAISAQELKVMRDKLRRDNAIKAAAGAAAGGAGAAGAAAGSPLNRIARGAINRISRDNISSRPVDASGRTITFKQMEQSNRDVGAMSDMEVKAIREAMKRAERIQAEEANESRLMRRAKGGYMRGGMHQKKK